MFRNFKSSRSIQTTCVLVLLSIVGVIHFHIIKITVQIDKVSKKIPGLLNLETEFVQIQQDFLIKINDSENTLRDQFVLLAKLEEFTNRLNVLIYGVEEHKVENVRFVVAKLINETLRYPLEMKAIMNAIRINHTSSGPRPIKVTFLRWSDKKEVLQRRKLLPAKLQILDDFTELQIKMQRLADDLKKKGKKIRWKGKRLFVDNIETKLDNLQSFLK